MLDAWLKSKFYARSKANIKLTKTRIEKVKKKRNVKQKILRNDIADLLKIGLDINAYSGQAEGLLAELNLSRCYDLLEQYCDHISNNLVIMYKQRECPEECREAVSSLIFAAARIADVPELRQLRSVFTERYGNSLECYVSKELFRNLKCEPPTKEMKLQLMKDIASENGIEWNLKALEQKLYNPLVLEQDWSKTQKDQKQNLHRKDSNLEHYNSSYGRKVAPDDEHSSPIRRNTDRHERDSISRKSEDSPPVKDIEADVTCTEEQQNKPEIDRIVPEEESDYKKPINYKPSPAPYTRSRATMTKNTSDPSPTSSTGEENSKDGTVEEAKPKPRSARTRRGTKVTVGDDTKERKDDEEKITDRLLMHFSRKMFQNGNKKPEPAKTPKQDAIDNITSVVSKRRIVGNRSASLPVELEQTSPRELSKGHNRANSFQPDMLGSNRHVHPKLPDYDEFVARLASLREQSKE